MAQYCDSAKLESSWFKWLVASHSPALEPYRSLGLVWTAPVEFVTDDDGVRLLGPDGRGLADPRSDEWRHCFALGVPHWCKSSGGELLPDEEAASDFGFGVAGVPDLVVVGDVGSEDPIHGLSDPFWVQGFLVPELVGSGYSLDVPAADSWGAVVRDVASICEGVARKFNQPDDESRTDLAQEALTQVLRKMVARKLVYMPGKAPVFNLLTTTIYRCMFSIMNKATKGRKNTHRLASDLRAGVLPRSLRSLRVPGQLH